MFQIAVDAMPHWQASHKDLLVNIISSLVISLAFSNLSIELSAHFCLQKVQLMKFPFPVMEIRRIISFLGGVLIYITMRCAGSHPF